MREFQYYCPTKVVYGEGSLRNIGAEVKRFGKKVMLVSSLNPPLPYVDNLNRVASYLQEQHCDCINFDQVESDPFSETIEKGAKMAKELDVDVMVGFGGGSAMDAAKGIAVAATHPGNILSYSVREKGSQLITEKTLPTIAIPTTAGTGSELTQAVLISDKKEKSKEVIRSPFTFPKVALIDPEMSATMPRKITAYTGMDALCQSIEAYVNTNAQVFADAFAIESIKLISKSFRAVIADGRDLQARGLMALGAALSGLAVAYSGVGATHALSLVLGGRYHVPHGLGIAMLLPLIVEYNLQDATSRYVDIASTWGITGSSDEEVTKLFVDEMYQLQTNLGIEQKLREFNVKEEELEDLGKAACETGDMIGNPRSPSSKEIASILKKIL